MLQTIGGLIGGIGLFLLGMWLMTEGLKVAAGEALQTILHKGTRTPLRGLLSGTAITALVQHSGAVTVATIGFVNAGFLSLFQSMWVIFGSNIGTTMTGWLVALVGFEFNIAAFALPAVGLGMALRLSGPRTRRGALGQALAGFGVFFIGLGVMQQTFAGLDDSIPMDRLDTEGFDAILLFIAIGFLLTTAMQSSSASLALGLTAAASGVIPLVPAAALVIGANVGSTTTAALSVIGATSNAKRVAAAHIAFNLLTGIVAALLLPWLLTAIVWLRDLLDMAATPAPTLALFHTVFNILGVLLIWPLARPLARLLAGRFRTAEEDAAKPRYLDDTALAVPTLAVSAAIRELQRIGGIARGMARSAIAEAPRIDPKLDGDLAAVDRLADAVGEFVTRIAPTHAPREIAEALPDVLRAAQYLQAVALAAHGADRLRLGLAGLTTTPAAPAVAAFKRRAGGLLDLADTGAEGFDLDALRHDLTEVEQSYDELKAALLRMGTERSLSIPLLDRQLQQLSQIRRALQQTVKAAQRLDALTALKRQALAPPVTPSDDSRADTAETSEGAAPTAPAETAPPDSADRQAQKQE